MSTILSTAVSGLNSAVSRATQSARNIVNASSTGKNIDKDLVDVNKDKTDYAANAAVIKTTRKMEKALLDIMV